MLKIEDAVQRVDDRPGFSVVNYREVGLPVFRLKVLSTLQAEQQIGPIENYILQSIAAGINDVPNITEFLGLPRLVVESQIGAMAYENLIVIKETKGSHLTLTPRGKTRLEEATFSEIEKKIVPVHFDGITRRIVPLDPADLFQSATLQREGIPTLAPMPRRGPRIGELGTASINKSLQASATSGQLPKRVIRVDSLVDKAYLNFRKAVAVAFKSVNGRDIAIGFLIDGKLASEHEKEFALRGGPQRTTILKDIFDSQIRRREIQAVAREVDCELPGVAQFQGRAPARRERKERTRTTLSLGSASSGEPVEAQPRSVRTVSVYEHPKLLERALNTARKRLIIISPWIRGAIVNREFVRKIESLLKNDVEVIIAYGLGRVEKAARAEDAEAIAMLSALDENYENFRLVRKGNTHAKVLVCDEEFFVTTSFNWLSFRGDPQLPFREEEGTYVGGETVVRDYAKKLLGRMSARQ